MSHINGNRDYQINKWKEIFLNKLKEYNPDDTRTCISCGKRKKVKLFYSGIIVTSSGNDSFRLLKKCKDCSKEDVRKRHKLKMDDKNILKRKNYKDRHRYTAIKTAYGISKEQYDNMLADQDNRCAICNDFMPRPYVDHCHSNNKVRGLLCMKCNTGLGQFRDDIKIMNSAIQYIEKYSS